MAGKSGRSYKGGNCNGENTQIKKKKIIIFNIKMMFVELHKRLIYYSKGSIIKKLKINIEFI